MQVRGSEAEGFYKKLDGTSAYVSKLYILRNNISRWLWVLGVWFFVVFFLLYVVSVAVSVEKCTVLRKDIVIKCKIVWLPGALEVKGTGGVTALVQVRSLFWNFCMPWVLLKEKKKEKKVKLHCKALHYVFGWHDVLFPL